MFSLVKWLFKKKGAIRGPVAPTNIEARPLILPTLINDLDFLYDCDYLTNSLIKSISQLK